MKTEQIIRTGENIRIKPEETLPTENKNATLREYINNNKEIKELTETKNNKNQDEVNAQANILQYLYLRSMTNLQNDYDAMSVNMTPYFFHYIEDALNNKELLQIQINGSVATGKSTVAIALMSYVQDKLEESKKSKKTNRLSLILGNQLELTRAIQRLEDYKCVVIDEISSLANTGLNATTEQAELMHQSDLWAQHFIHKIYCAPSKIIDPNINIILNVIGKDVEKKITRCQLIYRDITTCAQGTLGYVDFDVSNILDTKFYQKYRELKFNRMDLLTSHGVRDIRELESGSATINVYNKLKPLVEISSIQSPLIKEYVLKEFREKGLIISLITLDEITTRAGGLLQMTAELRKLKSKQEKAKEDDKQKIQKLIDIYREAEKEMMDYQYKILALSEQYDKIREIKIKEAEK